MDDELVHLALNSFTTNQVILVVEDSDEDFAAFTRVMKEAAFSCLMYRTCNGDDALDYLYRQGSYTDPRSSPRPSVILIDLNLPGTDGREVIEQLKQDETLKMIPIVVLTTSSSPKDIEACYRYGVNTYILKPFGVDALRKSIQNFLSYWFETAVLPTPS
ncbi:MAG: response regulator [Scytonema sp. PMC 1069.18]|nr:response regulator [Scytonema sp. PMC 1069.18]MEC4886161.1 response regulator [Scytonema sp. PMC 1070.18]